jgi:F0F1-type ATP synthase membrane subunit a
MKQSRKVSATEAFLNIGSGFIIALIVWQLLAGFLGIPMPIGTNVFITSVFTVVSVVRSYIWRRLFTNWLNEKLHKFYGDFEDHQDAVL